MAFGERVDSLDEQELVAMTRAATWYANYFAAQVEAEASATDLYAVEQRRDYLALVSALQKLGIKVALPDGLQTHVRQAA